MAARNSSFQRVARWALCLWVCISGPAAWAAIQMQSVNLPAVIGRGQTVAVTLSYQATGAGPTDVITVPIPSNLQVGAPATAGCVTVGAPGAETLTCTITTPALGDNGAVQVYLTGRAVLSGLNITATSGNTVSQSYSVIEAGDLLVAKSASAATVVNGKSFTFTLTPSVAAGGDPVANTAVVRITDTLPGSTAQYKLTAISAPGYVCNSVAAAQAARQVVCDFTGNGVAAMGTIVLTGNTTLPGTGNLTNNVNIATADSKYIDLNVNNNTGQASVAVSSGTDPEPLGSFAASALTSTAQNFTLTYRDNGPQATTGAVVRVAVPASFTVDTVPAGCVDTATSGTINGVTGDIIACTTGTVASGGTQAFVIGLTTPAAATSGNFGIEVVTTGTPPLLPDGAEDYQPANNLKLVAYNIVVPAADLTVTKSKSAGPIAAGGNITNTLSVTNSSIATATYSAAGGATPLRVVDTMSMNEVYVSASVGWTCTAFDDTPAVGQRRVVCERTAGGTLAPAASLALTLTTQVLGSIAVPTALTNTACTGLTALTQLGLTGADGPQPADTNAANDCAPPTTVIGTPIGAGGTPVPVSIVKESSIDNATWVDPTTPTSGLPRLLAANDTLYWRWTIQNTSGTDTIPTLHVADTLPAIANVNKTAPVPSAKTPAITPVTTVTVGSATGSCPALAIGASVLACDFTNVAPGTTIVVTIPVSRPLLAVATPFTNTATLSSPDAILTGTLSDAAALYIDGRSDWVVTAVSVNPGTPKIGQDITFTAVAANYGPDVNSQPVKITSHVDPAKYELTTATAAGMTCAINNPAAGDVTCTENAVSADPYVTRTVNFGARVLKPGSLPPSGNVYTGETVTASVVMNAADCEWRVESSTAPVSTSAACNDAAATSNNSRTTTFDVTVPVIDLVQRKLQVFPGSQTAFGFGDALAYRLRIQNAGPSRAEGVQVVDRISLPTGVTVASIAVSSINGVAADPGYTLDASKTSVSCSVTPGVPSVPTPDSTLPGAAGDVVCVLDPVSANRFLGANREVNFLLSFTLNNSLTNKYIAGNRAAACADETQSYEPTGKCSFETSGANNAGNNIAVVSDVVYPKTDLAITKTRVTAHPADVGQPVRYDLAVQNLGANGTTKIRVTDQLPANFEWVTGMAKVDATTTLDTTPAAVAAGAGAGSVSAVSCSASPATLTVVGGTQLITCDLSGNFPASATASYTLTLWARAKPGFFTGPYLNNRTNTATVYPGKDGAGADMSIDTNAANNSATANTQITKATLAGRVFLDLNNNGDQNGTTVLTDQGLGGVTLTLTGTDRWGNAVSRTVTTDNSALGVGSTRGDYLFDNLAASDAAGYTITQTQPAAFGNGTPQPNTARTVRNGTSTGTTGPYAFSNSTGTSVISGVRLEVGAAGVQFDFPENQKPVVSGFVYLDVNSDGGKTAGETGIDGVSVRLIGCRAGANGVIDTAGAVAAGPAVCTGDDVAVDLTTTTATDPTLGAGYFRFVLEEPGRYSLLQQTVQPVVGSTVTLRGKTTAGSVDKISSAAGSNDAGTRGTVNATAANAGGAAGVQQEVAATVAMSQIRDIVITDSSGQSVNNIFGEVLPASVSGTVYTEKGTPNSNYAAGIDWPLPGATVTLTGTDDLGQAVSLSSTTNLVGGYAFSGLRPGTYQVVKTNPVGIINEVGGAYPGQDGTSVTRGVRVDDNTINTVALTSAMAVVNTNFAVTNGPPPDATISAYVWVDRDRDHFPDNEEKKRLEGVTIHLVQGADCATGTVVKTAQTDYMGAVYFKGQIGQNYLLCQIQPVGYGNGNADGVPGSNSIAINNLQYGGSLSHFFGEWPGSIAGAVYEDFSSVAGQTDNGVRDAGENGIANVPVTLSGRDVYGAAVNFTTTTDANGFYAFDDLVAPDAAGYTVTEGVIPPASGSYLNGKDSVGNASVAPGNAASVKDQISGIRIAAGERATGYNFGELKAGSVSGTVFFDQNGNGTQEAAEPGIPGVTLTLSGTDLNGAAVNRSSVTDSAGQYRFDGLQPSSASGYTVTEQIEQPMAPGTALRTTNGMTSAGSIAGARVGVATSVTQLPSAVSAIVLPMNGQSVQNNFAETLVLSPDLVVTKSADKAVFTENNNATYTVRVKNVGTAPTVGSYTVVDQLSASGTAAKWILTSASGAGWTCSIGTDQQQVSCTSSQVLAAGEESSATIQLGVHINAGAVSAGPLRNVVSVSGGGEPPEKQPQPEEKRNPPACTAQPQFNVCVLSTPLQVSVGLDGHVWIDGSRKLVLDGSDKLLPQWIVEVYDMGAGSGKSFAELVRAGKPAYSTTTDAQGHYQVCGLEPGHEYRVLFRDPASRIAFPGVVTNEAGRQTGAEYWSQVKTFEGFEVLQVRPPAAGAGASSNACNVTAIEQSLPMDPNGVVYDSKSREPVAGATVALVPDGVCAGYDPQKYIINYETYGKDTAGNPTMLTGPDGFYKFLLSGDPAAPKSCSFKLVVTSPPGYKPAPSALIPPKPPLATPAAPGIFNVQPQKPAPTGNQDTSYHLTLTLGLSHQEVFNNHIPLDPMVAGSLQMSKTGDKRVVQIGDTLLYTVTVSQSAGDPTAQVTVRDRLPLGFTFVPGTVRVDNVLVPDPVGAPGGPVLLFQLGGIKTGQQRVLTYRLRVGVGAQMGDGVNAAQAFGCTFPAGCVDPKTQQPRPGTATSSSNPGRFRVEVGGGVFGDSACVLGKVFVDCNHNHVQDPEEMAIPGVRLYFETGAYVVTDSEGKYSQCGLTPRSHVLKVDTLTLPQGARLTTSSNRNLGDANSVFIDAKSGMVQRADFIEGSCSNAVLEQVKARRAQGEVRSVEIEKGGGLRLQPKPDDAPRQATDSANQPWVQPRSLVPNAAAQTTGGEHAR